jgi:hypothetical protein
MCYLFNIENKIALWECIIVVIPVTAVSNFALTVDNKLQMILEVSNTAGNFGLTVHVQYQAAKASLPCYTYFLELGSNSRLGCLQ